MSLSSASPSPDQPALAPPPGVPAEFFSPFTLRPYHALTIIASVVTTTVMMAARLYTKKCLIKTMKWEDCEYIQPIPENLTNPRPDACLVGWVSLISSLVAGFLAKTKFQESTCDQLTSIALGDIHDISRYRMAYWHSWWRHPHVEPSLLASSISEESESWKSLRTLNSSRLVTQTVRQLCRHLL